MVVANVDVGEEWFSRTKAFGMILPETSRKERVS